jgi:hypothetical protein
MAITQRSKKYRFEKTIASKGELSTKWPLQKVEVLESHSQRAAVQEMARLEK